MLRREQKIRNIVLFTLFSILFIGVGYAVISSSLNINGSLQLNKITWDVHFENFVELDDNTVKSTSHEIASDGTKLTYSVKLTKPGDKYSFTVDVVNSGNLDAMIQSLGNSGLNDTQKQVINYSVKYIDGNSPKEKDVLSINESETFLVSISAKADITNSQLSSTDTSLTLKLNPTYAQDDGTSVERPKMLYNTIVADAQLDTAISFGRVSSETNGRGIYMFEETKSDKFPIYYYRGAVTNNNLIFDNICWQIVRTTDTGGIKVIYNGKPNSSNGCTPTDEETMIGNSKYNERDFDNTYAGYMYGIEGATTLEDTTSKLHDSVIKRKIDSWYEENLINSTYKLEDTVWCNNTTVASGTGIGSARTRYKECDIATKTKEGLVCPNKNDSFTVSPSNGNGKLTYPVALITGYELRLVGGVQWSSEASDSFINNNNYWWSMTPSQLKESDKTICMTVMHNSNILSEWHVVVERGVRPMVSLKHATRFVSGDGTAAKPYIIN